MAEPLNEVLASLDHELGDTVDVIVLDGAGRRFEKTVEATTAKRKAARDFNYG